MTKIVRLALVSVLFSAACSDDEFTPVIDAATIDAPEIDAPTDAPTVDADPDAIPIDAPIDAMSSVTVVQCPGNPDLEINAGTGAFVFTPSNATINVDDIVEFTPGDPNHNMVSGAPGSPAGLFSTPTGQVTCLRFTAAGTFPFFCSVHSFTGTLTVQ